MGTLETNDGLLTIQGELTGPLLAPFRGPVGEVAGPLLLIESSATEARRLAGYLEEQRRVSAGLSHVASLEEGLRCLEERYFAAVLVSDALPDADREQALRRVVEAGTGAAIIALGPNDDERSIGALHAGAHDYLVREQISGVLLARALRHAIERRREQARLAQLETDDPLTGLANRAHFRARLQRVIARARGAGRAVVLMSVDIDRFSMINESFGHEVGDAILRGAAGRLRAQVRSAELLGRLGGDELGVVLDVEDPRDVAMVAAGVAAALAAPFNIAGQELFVTTAMGIAIAPIDAEDASDLMNRATSARKSVKASGGNAFAFYAPEMNKRVPDRFALESRLRRALSRGEYIVHYQPKVDVDSGLTVGVEALIRWQSGGELISPLRFVPILEETGQIVDVGEWVLRTVAEQLRAWTEPELRYLSIAVNVSARQLRDPAFAERVTEILREAGIYPPLIELEITESLLIEDPERSKHTLARLKRLGVRIAIDDFGVGYSSLNYLASFPVDVLKIDQSFVRHMSGDANRATIVAGIVQLAHSLGLKVVAEGVEDEAQLALLRDFGCDTVQGYLFSKPLPAEALHRWLSDPEGWREATV